MYSYQDREIIKLFLIKNQYKRKTRKWTGGGGGRQSNTAAQFLRQ